MRFFRNRYLLLEGEPNTGGTGPGGTPAAVPPPVNPNAPLQGQLPLDPALVTPPPVQSYSAEEYNKLLAKNRTLTETNTGLNGQLKTNELAGMKDKEQWKEIAELKENENTELRQRNESLTTGVIKREKMSAIRTAAVQAGIRKEALDDLDLYEFPEVQIETTSLGNYNVVGVQTAVEALKLRKPYMFGKKSGNLNPGLPEVTTGGMVTIDQVMKAADKARKDNSPESQAEYARLTKFYNQQRRGT